MVPNSKSKKSQKTGGSGKTAGGPSSAKDNDYPDIIEEPIRVIGDRTRGKVKASKSKKSGKAGPKK